MDLTPYTDRIRDDLKAAADAAGPESAELVDKLGFAVDAAARLAIMEAVSAAVAELSEQLPHQDVAARLAGRDLCFSVHPTAPMIEAPKSETHETDDNDEADSGATARVTVRMPESLKARAEARAEQAGVSLNSWIVNTLKAAAARESFNVDAAELLRQFLGNDPFGKRGGWPPHGN